MNRVTKVARAKDDESGGDMMTRVRIERIRCRSVEIRLSREMHGMGRRKEERESPDAAQAFFAQ